MGMINDSLIRQWKFILAGIMHRSKALIDIINQNFYVLRCAARSGS